MITKIDYKNIQAIYEKATAIEVGDMTTTDFDFVLETELDYIEPEEVIISATGEDRWDNVYDLRFIYSALNTATYDPADHSIEIDCQEGYTYKIIPLFKKGAI